MIGTVISVGCRTSFAVEGHGAEDSTTRHDTRTFPIARDSLSGSFAGERRNWFGQPFF